MIINIKNVKGQVEYFLRNEPATRDSDSLLTIRIWRKFYENNFNNLAHDILSHNDAGAFDHLRELPSQDNIKRIRAAFNQESKYFPTSWEVAKKRGIKEDEWRIELGYPAKFETQRSTKQESYMDPQNPQPVSLFN